MGCLAELIADTETGETPVKHPDEERTYGFDFSADLSEGEEILDEGDVTLTSVPDDLVFSNKILVDAGTQLNVLIGGGSHLPGQERMYKITAKFFTSFNENKITVGQLIVGTP